MVYASSGYCFTGDHCCCGIFTYGGVTVKSKLDEAIAKCDLTQTEAAAKIGVSLNTFVLWLRYSRTGKGRLPTSEQAICLELALGVKDFRTLFPTAWPDL
jgi:hypothetical protein